MKLLIALGQTAFEWTWKTSIYATLLIVLVFVVQELLAKWLTPRLRYTLSLLVLIRLLLPVTPSSLLSFENLFPPAARLANPVAIFPVSNQSIEAVTVIQQSDASRLVPVEANPIRISVSGILGIIWASGGLGLLLLAVWRLGKWNGLIRKGRLISDPSLLNLLNSSRTAMHVRKPVKLVAIAQLSSPAVFGLFRLRLLLPETALRQLDNEELRMIFLHEMAHVRRKDIRLNYLLMAVQFLHWFNPLVWLAVHRLRADRELVCDAMVMQKVKPEERLGYGKVLLKLVDGFSAGNLVFSGAVPVLNSMDEIERRILMIKNHRTASIAACLTTALLVMALAFGSFTHARGQEQPTAAQNPGVLGQRVESHSAVTNHLAEMTKPPISNLNEQLKTADDMARVKAVPASTTPIFQMRLVVAEDPQAGPPKESEKMNLVVTNHASGQTYVETLWVNKTILIDQSDLEKATVVTVPFGSNPGRPEIDIAFTPKGGERFAEVTRQSINKRLAVIFDGHIISAPVIKTEIRRGLAIAGEFTRSELTDLSNKINQALKK